MNKVETEIALETTHTWIKSGKTEAEKVSKKAVDLVKNGFCDGEKLLLDKDFDSMALSLLVGWGQDIIYAHSSDENGYIQYDLTEQRNTTQNQE